MPSLFDSHPESIARESFKGVARAPKSPSEYYYGALLGEEARHDDLRSLEASTTRLAEWPLITRFGKTTQL
jgi:hypothetical protein